MNIFKLSAILGLSLIMVIPMQACKKGEDDPALSFRSRDARIKGEWVLNSASENMENILVRTNLEVKTTQTTVITQNREFNGNTYSTHHIYTQNNNKIIDTIIIDTITYRITYNFKENGVFHKEELRIYPNNSQRILNFYGKWSWAYNTQNKIAVDISLDGEVKHFLIPELRNESMRFENKDEFSEKYKRPRPNPQVDEEHDHRIIRNQSYMVFEKR